MLCSNPFIRSQDPQGKARYQAMKGNKTPPTVFPCGQCFNCRINKARAWVVRLRLELYDHTEASFVTLTYNNFYLPNNFNLFPKDLQLFFKKLRSRTKKKIRYYYCGEYGERTGRPHYHVCLFGMDETWKKDIESAWTIKGYPLGNVHIGDLSKDSIRYVAGYCMKGATKYVDESKAKDKSFAEKINKILDGRRPEFHRMSRSPGIGSKAIERIAGRAVNKADTIRKINIDGKTMFIGKYLRSKSDKVLGYDDPDGDEFNFYLNELFNEYQGYDKSYYDSIVSGNAQRRLQKEKRFRMFTKDKGL